jgi:hypothetical protein
MAHFKHVAEHRDAPPLSRTGGIAQQLQRRPHRGRIGIVALVDQHETSAINFSA